MICERSIVLMEFRENIKTLLKGGAFSLKKKKKKDRFRKMKQIFSS